MLLLLLGILVVTLLELSGKEIALPPGVFGLVLGVSAALGTTFTQPWKLRRIVTLSVAGVLLVLSSLQLAGVPRLGFLTGAAMVGLCVLMLTTPKLKT